MSRIGKKEIHIPEKTTATIAGGVLTIQGPLGSLTRTFKKNITITIVGSSITSLPIKDTLENKALWGTYASHIQNMIEGVNKGFEKRLIVEGVGYKADVTPAEIVFKVGFSHPVKIKIPKGIKVTSDKGVLVITGIDKEVVASFAATIKSIKKPEPYKGKGIRYENEVIRRKEGKKTA